MESAQELFERWGRVPPPTDPDALKEWRAGRNALARAQRDEVEAIHAREAARKGREARTVYHVNDAPSRPSLRVVDPSATDLADVCDVVRDAWSPEKPRTDREDMSLADMLARPARAFDYLQVFGRDGWLARGQLHLLAAEAGAGKTFFLSGVMAELAEAGERIAWVNEEGDDQTVLLRQSTVKAHLTGKPIKGDIRWITPDGLGGPEKIADRAMKYDPTVIIVDTVANVLGIEDENGSSEVARALRPWARLAHEHNIAVILVHHNNKAMFTSGRYGGIRGSSALVARVDVVLQLTPHGKDDNRRDLKVSKKLKPQECVYVTDLAGRMTWDDGAQPVQQKGRQTTKDAVYEEFVAADGRTLNLHDLAARLPGVTADTIRKAANELADAGDLVKASKPTRGQQASWRLRGPEDDI